MDFKRNVRILINKNLTTEIRYWKRSVLEVVIILFLFFLILLNPFVRSYRYDYQDNTVAIYDEDNLDNLDILKTELRIKTLKIKLALGYTPILPTTTRIVEDVVSKFKLHKATGFKEPLFMEAKFNNRTTFASVHFHNFAEEKSRNLTISLRFPSDFRTIGHANIKDSLWLTRCNGILAKHSENVGHEHTDLYFREGFLQLQHQLFLSWLHVTGITANEPSVDVKSFRHEKNPYECDVVTTGSNLLTVLFYICFLYPFLNLVKRFAYELENHIFVHHLKFGFSYLEHWVAHFVVAFGHCFVLIFIVLLICKIPWMHDEYTYNFGRTSLWMILIFLVLYITALIITAMALVCLVPVVGNAMLLGSLIWLITYAMFSIVLDHTETLLSIWIHFAFLVFFNNTFSFAMHFLKDYTIKERSWEFLILYAGLLGNILLHLIVLSHFQYFWPGKYVLSGPYHFCSRPKKPKPIPRRRFRVASSLHDLSWTHIEFSNVEEEIVMELKHIDTVEEAHPKMAQVKNISMKIYRGEITVILGHNGCGKTTLMCIMAGLYKPRKGSITIKGKDLYNDWTDARKYFDICLPESPLFEKFTASEILMYYYHLKQDLVSCQEWDTVELNNWMYHLRLVIPDPNMLIDKMSYDQKRLLFLCCALCANTDVVLLDNPTEKMRWRESNLYWHILHQHKVDRAIVVTLNSIDMADRHADRVFLMNEGAGLAYGTKNFLKSTFGLHPLLTILKEPSKPIEPITSCIKQFISGIEPERIVGEQVYYRLKKEFAPYFQHLLIRLEKGATNFGIKSLTLFGSDLFDVFMSLGMQADSNKRERVLKTVNTTRIHYLKDKELVKQQIRAMAFKNIINQTPSFIPLIMIFVVLFLILVMQNMSAVLVVPPKEEIYIEVGLTRASSAKIFTRATDGHSVFASLAHCNIIYIDHIGASSEYTRLNPRVYDRNSLHCVESMTFEEYINQTTTSSLTVGAVERNVNETNKYTIWFNQKIFHSAPVVLNLLHNLILSDYKIEESKTTVINGTSPIGGNTTSPVEEPAPGRNTTSPVEEPAPGGNTTSPVVEPAPGGNTTSPVVVPAPGGNTTSPGVGSTPVGNATSTGDGVTPADNVTIIGNDMLDFRSKNSRQSFADEEEVNFEDHLSDDYLGRNVNSPEENDTYAAYVINNPMPIPLETKVNLLEIELHHISFPLTVGIIMPLTVSTFAINVIHERTNQMRMLMEIAGLKLKIYWFVTYIWDVMTFMAYSIFFILIMAFSTIDGFKMFEKLIVLMLFWIYSFSAIPMTYYITLLFKGSRLRTYLWSSFIHVLTGLVFFVIYWDVVDNSDRFYYFAMFFPSFALLEALSNMYTEVMQERYCEHTCEKLIGCDGQNICLRIPFCCFDSFFKWSEPGILLSMTYLLGTAIIYHGLIFWIELYRHENVFSVRNDMKFLHSACYPYDTMEVRAVKKKYAEADVRDIRRENLVVDQLECELPTNTRSLHTVSFGVKKGSCLSIWGPRRSGKTHLVRQLIGQDSFNFGEVYIKGEELKYEPERAYTVIGYCPQGSRMCLNFTPREILHFFCMIRGMPEKHIANFINQVTKAFEMRSVLNKKLSTLSYDIRRKVIFSIAFMVKNDVVILDEPTRGLSAVSRYQMAKVISFVCGEGKSIVLTTVSGSEASMISDNSMLFEDGEMLSYGSMKYICREHMHGFYLEFKLKQDGEDVEASAANLRKDIENLNRFVTFIDENSELRARKGNVLRYFCPIEDVLFSRLYGALEKNRRRLNISSYLVLQRNVEDTFSEIVSTRKHKCDMYPQLQFLKPH